MYTDTADIIIIGAGIAGIAASLVLTQRQIPHIILQSRDRIGGRIYSQQFCGKSIDLGASFVHNPKQNNLVAKLLKNYQWKRNSARYDDEQYYYSGKGQMPEKITEKAYKIYEKMTEKYEKKGKKNPNLSIGQVSEQLIKQFEQNEKDELIIDTVLWHIRSQQNLQGANLKQISIRTYSQGQQCETDQDYIPNPSYSQFIKTIFKNSKGKLILNSIVNQIDYSKQGVIVKSQTGIYKADKIISSLPLGVMKSKVINFVPKLPYKYQEIIDGMGNGVANKLLVAFKQPFWPKKASWLNFITPKDKCNKYYVAKVFTQNILCFFVSGESCIDISKWNKEQITKDLSLFLKNMTGKQIEIIDLKLTKWHEDKHSMGSYCFIKAGRNHEKDSNQLRQPLQNKIWLVGEYTHWNASMVHSAFTSGFQAANELLQQYEKKKVKIDDL